jgi:hypothetical protein
MIYFDDIAREHGFFFRDIKPTTGIYEINGLVSPDYLVEIELRQFCRKRDQTTLVLSS